LKDGETQVLAGLINDEDRSTANKVPGIGDLPVLGRLFSTHRDDNQKTEIVLSITPHLIRNLKLPNARASEFWSGSETTLRTSPVSVQHQSQSVKAEAKAEKSSAIDKFDHAAPVSNVGNLEANLPDVAPTKIGLFWQGPKQVQVGGQFQVTLMLKADGGVMSLPFQMAYDSSALKVVSVTEGDFFKQDGTQTSFTSNVDAATGRVFVGVVRSGSGGVAGEGGLATVTFKSLAPQSKAEIKLLTATAVGVNSKTLTPEMPDAYSVIIDN
jgi:general secretion pathway protein D